MVKVEFSLNYLLVSDIFQSLIRMIVHNISHTSVGYGGQM